MSSGETSLWNGMEAFAVQLTYCGSIICNPVVLFCPTSAQMQGTVAFTRSSEARWSFFLQSSMVYGADSWVESSMLLWTRDLQARLHRPPAYEYLVGVVLLSGSW